MNTRILETNNLGVEKNLGCAESLGSQLQNGLVSTDGCAEGTSSTAMVFPSGSLKISVRMGASFSSLWGFNAT